jgi:hypothetical protein
MKTTTKRTSIWIALAAGAFSLAIADSASAQVNTETTANAGQASKQVTVDRATVIEVDGNDLFIKMENGEVRHFPNVPESAKVTVDGQQLGIHDLKPGMTLERTFTTTTTPRTVTTVQTVTGTVWHVMPPNSVILRLENGEHQRFTIPKGQRFTVEGKDTDAFALRKGMKVSATKITEVPEIVVEHDKQLTGKMPPTPAAIPADEPILIAQAAPTPASADETPAELPQTGSIIPLLGLAGLLCVGTSVGLRLLRNA